MDVRKGSPTFGQWVAVELSDLDNKQLFIPAGFAHGFYAFEESDVTYKCSTYYSPESDGGVVWDDTELGIQWPETPTSISDKDAGLPTLSAARLPLFETA